MPYINKEQRNQLKNNKVETAGELNYLICNLVDEYLDTNGHNYSSYNSVTGVLECAKMEIYRRLTGPYEDKKIKENGDIKLFS